MKKNYFLISIIAFISVSCFQKKQPQNIIFLIGDGMGVSHVTAGMVANGGKLNMTQMPYVGLTTTYSANNLVTDSGASGTALATGYKTNNRMIGISAAGDTLVSILKYAEQRGKSTGLISTSGITHATPASFIANRKNRNDYEGIAADFLKTDIDLFIGGGASHFLQREDGRDLTKELEEKGYQVKYSIEDAAEIKNGKLVIFTSDGHNKKAAERKNVLPQATQKALSVLSKNKKGFFLMVEGSQIDWAAHGNNQKQVIDEVLDFDRTNRCCARICKKKSRDFSDCNGRP